MIVLVIRGSDSDERSCGLRGLDALLSALFGHQPPVSTDIPSSAWSSNSLRPRMGVRSLQESLGLSIMNSESTLEPHRVYWTIRNSFLNILVANLSDSDRMDSRAENCVGEDELLSFFFEQSNDEESTRAVRSKVRQIEDVSVDSSIHVLGKRSHIAIDEPGDGVFSASVFWPSSLVEIVRIARSSRRSNRIFVDGYLDLFHFFIRLLSASEAFAFSGESTRKTKFISDSRIFLRQSLLIAFRVLSIDRNIDIERSEFLEESLQTQLTHQEVRKFITQRFPGRKAAAAVIAEIGTCSTVHQNYFPDCSIQNLLKSLLRSVSDERFSLPSLVGVVLSSCAIIDNVVALCFHGGMQLSPLQQNVLSDIFTSASLICQKRLRFLLNLFLNSTFLFGNFFKTILSCFL